MCGGIYIVVRYTATLSLRLSYWIERFQHIIYALILCREEDKVILQRCLHIQTKLSGSESCFKDVAEQLNKRPEQVGLGLG